MNRKLTKVLMTSAAMMSFSAGSIAQEYPSKPVTAIVQMAPGGPTDLIVRLIQQKMGEHLGQTVVVENKAGAGGLIGLRHVLNAPSDGYTLGIASATSHGVAVNIYENLPYDPLKDFRAIGSLVVAPGVLITSKKATPDCKFQTLIDKLKKSPNELQYGSAGIGTLAHLSGAAFLAETDTQMLHIPYRGLGPAMTDIYSGTIDAVFDNISSARSHIASGKVCALAIQSPQRLPNYPDIPTYAELGFPQLNKPTWYGLIAKADTPDPIVKKLNAALNATLESTEVRTAYSRLGVEPIPSTPDEFTKRMSDEIEFWRKVVAKINFEKLKL
ncbi:MAG TPA: tripartite tricarboxylate transporter substrate binding protein [Eoetvoesiella sp.]